jgi:single-stranded DNA-binding protein
MERPTTNKVILVGFVGRAPEIELDTARGPEAQFTLSTIRVQGHDWHRIYVRGDLARKLYTLELVAGDRVFVEGELHYDTFERDGVTVPVAEIWATEVLFLHSGQRAPEEVSSWPR